MSPSLRKHNATYLRNVADVLENGSYSVDAVGGADLLPGDIIMVTLSVVATPNENSEVLEEPLTVVSVGQALLTCVTALENLMDVFCPDDRKASCLFAVEKAKKTISKIGIQP